MLDREFVINKIIEEGLKLPDLTAESFHKVKNNIYRAHKVAKPFPSIEILQKYNEKIRTKELEENLVFKKILRKRGVRSLSGVTVISLLTKFFGCPGKCIYCPTFEGLPKSYIPNEPAVSRAVLNKFDPILQIHNRLRALEVTGHKIEKNDIRIIGGTWSFYPKEYREEFIKGIYDAFNTYDEMKEHIEETDLSNERFAAFKIKQGYTLRKSASIEEAKQKNATEKCRIIGIAIETRPDWVTEEEIKTLRRYGITRVEIGYQTTIDEINKQNKRGHGNKENIEATRLLKDAGIKVVAHMMPNLLGSNPELDIKAMKICFENSDFRPDELKIYPMVVTDNSELTDIWKNGGFQPYDDDTLINLMTELELMTPEYVRLNRTYRDIPASEILGGSKISNLHQVIEKRIKKEGKKLSEIRSREIKNKANNPENAVLKVLKYEASKGIEYFLTFEDPEDKTIFSLLRLRVPSQYFTGEKHFIKELENSAIIREVHTFGDQLSIGEAGSTFGQHIGFGKKLIQKAEDIIKKDYPNISKMSVISGIGVRGYYEKRGYFIDGEYMSKNL